VYYGSATGVGCSRETSGTGHYGPPTNCLSRDLHKVGKKNLDTPRGIIAHVTLYIRYRNCKNSLPKWAKIRKLSVRFKEKLERFPEPKYWKRVALSSKNSERPPLWNPW